MPRFDDGGVNIKLEKGDIILMGNPTQYGEILAETLQHVVNKLQQLDGKESNSNKPE